MRSFILSANHTVTTNRSTKYGCIIDVRLLATWVRNVENVIFSSVLIHCRKPDALFEFATHTLLDLTLLTESCTSMPVIYGNKSKIYQSVTSDYTQSSLHPGVAPDSKLGIRKPHRVLYTHDQHLNKKRHQFCCLVSHQEVSAVGVYLSVTQSEIMTPAMLCKYAPCGGRPRWDFRKLLVGRWWNIAQEFRSQLKIKI